MNRCINSLATTLLIAFLSFSILTSSAQADTPWPQRPITLIVPFPAGGGTDSLAREFALELAKRVKLVSSADLNLGSVDDLRALAQANPGMLNYCSAGPGSINHLAGALFQQRTGLDIQHVPYLGSGPATLDLLAGRVQLFFATMPTMLGHVNAGKVHLLAVTTRQRSALFPDTPTLTEVGIEDYDISTWWGILAPSGTPESIVRKLNQLANDITASPLISQRLTTEGGTVFSGSPEDFRAYLSKEMDMWDTVVASIPTQSSQ